ncbi:scavenger receptor cysteine-rich type 1 protein M160 [Pygocentrus nattereri]|uniref:scavenger receptor cysteine-rich type 1 protein M160 n=1 Tax=Pygocentrus nattereri TaxID=42514 RepID=UPI0018914848|nr:scavenger receptor cysteine-rich type 1 protein M160 [Pygocentrus nattereri]
MSLCDYESFPTAQNRIALRGPDSPCEGRLEVYNDGEWGLVCYHGWNSENGQDHKNGEVVCKSLGCGQHVESGHNKDSYKNHQLPTKYWMDEVKCSGTENNLWDCKKPRDTHCEADNYVTVKCSESVKLSLNMNGNMDECAGVVQFKTTQGHVSVCNNGWNKDKADMVCKELNCGKHHTIPQSGTFQRYGEQISYSVTLHCTGKETFSWQCVDWVQAKSSKCNQEASVICSNYKSMRLTGDDGDVCNGTLQQKNSTGNSNWVPVPYGNGSYIKAKADDICSKLNCGKSSSVTQRKGSEICLTCTDRVKVELEYSCYGNIYVRLNDTIHTVCSDGMTEEAQRRMGKVVCQQLNCGKLLTISQGYKVQNGLLRQVDCSGQEDTLWECLARYGPGPCQSTARVSCAAFTNVTLEDGLGKCSGRLQVKFEGLDWNVNATEWTKKNSDVVCEQLKCGKSHETQENLFVGSNHNQLEWNLNCSDGVSKLSQCTWTQRKDSRKKMNVNIICEKEKLWFLQGDSSCDGKVKVESAGKILPIQANEMPTDVCQWLHCGTVICSATTASHASCSRENATTQNTTDHVKCSGSVEVMLENKEKEKGWGKVKVCMNGMCRGVCNDTWTKKLSDMLCENQGSGKALSKEYRGSTEPGQTIGSVHCSQETRNLSHCYFALMSAQSACKTPVHVSCTGSVKVKLNDLRDKCAGRLELFYLGKWHPVCADGVSQETQNTFCSRLGCGKVVNFSKYGASKAEGLSGITCANNLSTCDFSKTKIQVCFTGHLNCSGWTRLFLTHPHSACVGKVYAQDHNGLLKVSGENWGPEKGYELCKYLNCGNLRNYSEKDENHNRTYNCGAQNDILDCSVNNKHAQFKHLSIKCDGNPVVNLLGNCTGEVRINQKERMCGVSQNTGRVLNELCHHLNCKHLITSWFPKSKGKAQYFSCTGHENRLWQCSSWTDNCDRVISVACANSVEFNFTGKCGGELQVRYRGNWEPLCLNSIEDAHMICRNQNCGKASSYKNLHSSEGVQTSFKCEKGETDPKSCVKYESCQEGKALIYCEKYVPVVKVVPPNTGLIVGLVVGLLFMLVAIAIMIWQRKRFLTILRLKSSGGEKDAELNNKEMQDLNKKNRDMHDRKSSVFEMDDYEDVDPIMNPMEDEPKSQKLQHAEDEDDEESRSGGSSRTQYDDVEESSDRQQEPENSSPAEPLLPPRPANLLDDVSYEVELEVLDDYDDATPAQAAVSESGESPGSEASEAADMLVGPDG